MKLAGIVRRIDELGRIVIPKEIRKTLHIKNGENLEIFISDDTIIGDNKPILYTSLLTRLKHIIRFNLLNFKYRFTMRQDLMLGLKQNGILDMIDERANKYK